MRGWTGKTTGRCSASAIEAVDRRGRAARGSSTSAGRCRVTRPYSPGSSRARSTARRARAASTCAQHRVDHRVADEVRRCSRSIPSRARLPIALLEWTSRTSRDVVGEHAGCAPRASRGRSCAGPARGGRPGCRASPRRARPPASSSRRRGRRRGRARRSSSTCSTPTSARAVCSACVPEPTPRKTSGVGSPSSLEEDVRHVRVVVLARCGRASSSIAGVELASARWTGAAFMKFGRAPTTKQMRADTRRASRRSVQSGPGGLDSLACSLLKALFWVSLGALLWTHVALPARRRRARARAHARACGEREIEPRVTRDRRRLQRGGGDRAAAREPARARLPADQLELVVTSDASTDRTDELVERFGDARPPARATRAAARSPRRTAPCARPTARSSPSPTRTRPGRPTRCASSCANFADPDVAYVCGQLVLEAADGSNREGALLALRDGAARGGVAARLDHRRQRLDLRGAARGLRRGRPALGPRPLVPVPDGAGGPPRGLRARGARVREADAVERDRVPAQGAHVRALLADHAARLDARARCRSATSSR